jgi:tRNA A-37 threonylcarbamoyl transferase component Bud32
MPTTNVCPGCGAALADDSPAGLCLRCAQEPTRTAADPIRQPGTNTAAPAGPFAAPAAAELAPHFPQLDVLELIGQGGMGAVYKARQVKLDRLVALKVLPPAIGHDPAFAARFSREARALARLSHPHIVAVHDFGEAAGLFYFLMEFVDGMNLRQRLRGGPLSPAEALTVAAQLCDALQYAHEEGVVHRDVKPENILLDKRGRVKVADFGLAKLLGTTLAEQSLTASQQVMGTVFYMAPEQIETPQQVDHRSDIYALGVLLYEMLTGGLPIGRFAPPSQKAAVDPRLDEVVLRALEKEPGRRYQHARELHAALVALEKEPEPRRQDIGEPKTVVTPAPAGVPAPDTPQFQRFLLAGVTGPTAVERSGPARTRTAPTTRGQLRRFLRSTTGWAVLLCFIGFLFCLLPWEGGPSPSGLSSGYGILAMTTFLTLVGLLLATSFIEPVPLWRPITVLAAGVSVVVWINLYLTGPRYSNGVPYVPLACGMGLLFLGTLQLRGVLMRLHRESAARAGKRTNADE